MTISEKSIPSCKFEYTIKHWNGGNLTDSSSVIREKFLNTVNEWGQEGWDFNAAKNIRNRVLVTVLRESLLKQLDNGAFEPKKLKREKVKEVLLSFRRNLQDNARSEYRESRLTTFDYV